MTEYFLTSERGQNQCGDDHEEKRRQDEVESQEAAIKVSRPEASSISLDVRFDLYLRLERIIVQPALSDWTD